MSKSSTHGSSVRWLTRHDISLQRYLRRNHIKEDRDHIFYQMYKYPDMAKNFLSSEALTNRQKNLLVLKEIATNKAYRGLVMADQRQGKDGFIGYECEELLYYAPNHRVVTLNNTKKPPYVNANDMFFSWGDIPYATGNNYIMVYCSELETVFPSRESKAVDTVVFSQNEGTMAQNHQKMMGAVKLMSKVDLNVIRGATMKFFKYINPMKLQVDGIERDGVLNGLGRLLIPKDRNNKEDVLVIWEDNLVRMKTPLPEWWSTEYSEMYSAIPLKQIYKYIKVKCINDGVKPLKVAEMVLQKFRKRFTEKEIINIVRS